MRQPGRPENQVISSERKGAPCVWPDVGVRRNRSNRIGEHIGANMDLTTLLIIVVVVLLLGGGGWYGRGRWY